MDETIIDDYKCNICMKILENYISEFLDNDFVLKDLKKKLKFKRFLRSSSKSLQKYVKYMLDLIENPRHYFDINYNKNEFLENDFLCNKCLDIRKKSMYRYSLNRLVKSYLVSILFNTITSRNIIEVYKYLLNSNLRFDKVNRQKLRELSEINNVPNSLSWKGSNYYYKKLFDIPLLLEDIEIPKEVYLFRENIYLNDYICGHPMASNGWFKESLDELIELGLFD